MNLVNEHVSRSNTFVLSDGNSDKSASRETHLAFEGSVIKHWNIVVEEPTYREYFGIEDGERSTEHSITFRNSEFTGDIVHNSKDAGLMTDFSPLVSDKAINSTSISTARSGPEPPIRRSPVR